MNLNNIYKIAITIAILLIIYIFQDWLRTKIIVALGGYTKKETKIVTEKEYIQGKIDTIAVFNHYVETKGIVLNPKPKIVYVESKENPVKIDSTKKFNVQIKDSLIDGNLTINNKFNGDLYSTNFKYKPLFPKYITRVDTIKITKTITETLTKERAFFGLGAGYDVTNNNIQFLGGYTTKKGLQFMYEYETPLQKDLLNSLPKQASHSIKIIKNF